MRYTPQEISLRDGTVCIFRSPEESDAAPMIDYLRQTSGETHFMLRNPEDIKITTEEEVGILSAALDNPHAMLLAAFEDGLPVASAGLFPVADRDKTRHRGHLGLSVLRACWGRGIGRKLMEILIQQTGEMGFTQVELSVFSDNERALGLYKTLGFEVWGLTPSAFRLRDGTFRDEISMGRIL